MKEYRCKFCHKLLFKTEISPLMRIQVKCPKCKKINFFDDAPFIDNKRVKIKV